MYSILSHDTVKSTCVAPSVACLLCYLRLHIPSCIHRPWLGTVHPNRVCIQCSQRTGLMIFFAALHKPRYFNLCKVVHTLPPPYRPHWHTVYIWILCAARTRKEDGILRKDGVTWSILGADGVINLSVVLLLTNIFWERGCRYGQVMKRLDVGGANGY